MVNYQSYFWISIAFNILLIVFFVIYTIVMKNKAKNIGKYINEIRKDIRHHHRSQKKLFGGIDKFMQLVPEMIIRKPKVKKQEEEYEFG